MKTLISLAFFGLIALAVPSSAFAAIDVTFQTTPLFGISNFLPGDVITKTVSVTNTGANTESVYTELINVVDGGLAPMVDVEITSGAPLFSGSFAAFDSANEQFLTTLSAGATIVYNYKMSFKPAAGNAYQNKSLGFDICVGFSGGAFECDKIGNPGYSQGSYGGGEYAQGSYGGGGYAQGSYSGGGGRSHSGGNGGTTLQPIPQVLGAQTSILPVGAPNTGFGGSTQTFTDNVFLLILSLLTVVCTLSRRTIHVG